MVQREWRVYGIDGHRQAASFGRSTKLVFRDGSAVVDILNADETGTNEYSVVIVTADTAEDCERELEAQLNDGIFENCRVGRVYEVPQWDSPTEDKQQICNKLLEALKITRDQRDLVALCYGRESGDRETVAAVYENDAVKKINVSLDSGQAMIADILKAIR